MGEAGYPYILLRNIQEKGRRWDTGDKSWRKSLKWWSRDEKQNSLQGRIGIDHLPREIGGKRGGGRQQHVRLRKLWERIYPKSSWILPPCRRRRVCREQVIAFQLYTLLCSNFLSKHDMPNLSTQYRAIFLSTFFKFYLLNSVNISSSQ